MRADLAGGRVGDRGLEAVGRCHAGLTVALSPGLRKNVSRVLRVARGRRVELAGGSGGPSGLPSRVRNAKLMYSTPPRTCDWHGRVEGLARERILGEAVDVQRDAPLGGIAAGAGELRDPPRRVELQLLERHARREVVLGRVDDVLVAVRRARACSSPGTRRCRTSPCRTRRRGAARSRSPLVFEKPPAGCLRDGQVVLRPVTRARDIRVEERRRLVVTDVLGGVERAACGSCTSTHMR